MHLDPVPSLGLVVRQGTLRPLSLEPDLWVPVLPPNKEPAMTKTNLRPTLGGGLFDYDPSFTLTTAGKVEDRPTRVTVDLGFRIFRTAKVAQGTCTWSGV